MMLRGQFSSKLSDLQDELLQLGSLVSTATYNSVQALINRDSVLAQEVVEGDREVNRIRFDWEEQALLLLATQSPVARDLRFLAAGLHTVDELERMGDHAKGNARISLTIGPNPLIYPQNHLLEMAEVACQMLDQALKAFTNRDPKLAEETGISDDILDELYNKTQGEIYELMFSDRSNINQGNMLLWVAHNLERIGDRITNICERVIFVCTGQMAEIPGGHARSLKK